MDISALDLLRLQTEALFTHDPDGGIRRVNEPDGDPAPRLFLGRTRLGNIWHLRYDVPEPLAGELERLLRAEPVVDDLRTPPTGLDAMRDLLAQHAPPDDVWGGPAYFFPDNLPAPSDIVCIDRQTRDLVRPFMSSPGDVDMERLEARWPCIVRLVDGVPVAICMSARLTERAAEAGVDTLAAYRGRGHAVAVVAGWAAMVRASGRVPLYSTAWDNYASQGVARRLGLELYATDHSIG